MVSDQPILIVGGGIGGLAAALALSRQGRATHVIEQSDTFGEIGAGIQIAPNVFKMFAALGLTPAINEVAVFPDALVMMDALSGKQITRIPLDGPFRARFAYPYGVIYRPDLHRVFLDACQAAPLVELSTGQKILGYEVEDGQVSVATQSGKTLTGAALIGADGLWSKIRQQMVGDGPPRVSGHIAYRAVLPTAQVPRTSRNNDVTLWAGPKTHLVHYPLRRGEIFNLVAVFHSDRYEEGWDVFGEPAELAQHFDGQHASVQAMLEQIDSWRMWVLCDRDPIKHWSRGPVTLLGDAAHPMLQYLAQGACMAIEDAVCLAGKVTGHGRDIAGAFQAYQQDRYLRTGRVQLTARFYGDVYHAAGVTAELRDMTLGNRAPAQAYQGMAWLYEGIDDAGAQQF